VAVLELHEHRRIAATGEYAAGLGRYAQADRAEQLRALDEANPVLRYSTKCVPPFADWKRAASGSARSLEAAGVAAVAVAFGTGDRFAGGFQANLSAPALQRG
jgi:hypothetical protein